MNSQCVPFLIPNTAESTGMLFYLLINSMFHSSKTEYLNKTLKKNIAVI